MSQTSERPLDNPNQLASGGPPLYEDVIGNQQLETDTLLPLNESANGGGWPYNLDQSPENPHSDPGNSPQNDSVGKARHAIHEAYDEIHIKAQAESLIIAESRTKADQEFPGVDAISTKDRLMQRLVLLEHGSGTRDHALMDKETRHDYNATRQQLKFLGEADPNNMTSEELDRDLDGRLETVRATMQQGADGRHAPGTEIGASIEPLSGEDRLLQRMAAIQVKANGERLTGDEQLEFGFLMNQMRSLSHDNLSPLTGDVLDRNIISRMVTMQLDMKVHAQAPPVAEGQATLEPRPASLFSEQGPASRPSPAKRTAENPTGQRSSAEDAKQRQALQNRDASRRVHAATVKPVTIARAYSYPEAVAPVAAESLGTPGAAPVARESVDPRWMEAAEGAASRYAKRLKMRGLGPINRATRRAVAEANYDGNTTEVDMDSVVQARQAAGQPIHTLRHRAGQKAASIRNAAGQAGRRLLNAASPAAKNSKHRLQRK